jgi:hypothetical protein
MHLNIHRATAVEQRFSGQIRFQVVSRSNPSQG